MKRPRGDGYRVSVAGARAGSAPAAAAAAAGKGAMVVMSPDLGAHVATDDVGTNRSPPSPLCTAGLLSRWTYMWLTPFVRLARRGALDETTLPQHYPGDRPAELVPAFLQFWEGEVADARIAGRSPSVWRSILRYHRWTLAGNLVLLLVCSSAWILNPALWIRLLIQYIEDGRGNTTVGLQLVAAMVVTEAVRSLCIQQYWWRAQHIGSRARSLVFGLVFVKATQRASTAGYTFGELTTMCSNDAERVFEACRLLCIPFLAIVELIAVLVLGCFILGPASIVGFVIVLLLIPLKLYSARVVGRFRRQLLVETDSRVRTLSEVVVAIKLIKMYAWEAAFSRKVMTTRRREVALLFRISFIQSLLTALMFVLPTLANVASFIVHIEAGHDLKASQAYTMIAIYNTLYLPLSVSPNLMRQLVEVRSGMKRLTALVQGESLDYPASVPKDTNVAVEADGLTYAWPGSKADGGSDDTVEEEGVLVDALYEDSPLNLVQAELGHATSTGVVAVTNLCIRIQRGELIGLCGAVGSGKTALISAVIGQMQSMSMPPQRVAVRGSMAYVSQRAWIQSTTVRSNILFGSPFEPAWYDEVVDKCCLLPDFELLENGDLTVVGERGINLSGGQKQRIAIARAVYAKRDVVLLDDPLSAVDVHVGQRIFSEVVMGLLRQLGTTVIMSTHRLHYLAGCDRIIFMDGGTASVPANMDELRETSGGFRRFCARPTHIVEAELGGDAVAEEKQALTEASPAAPIGPDECAAHDTHGEDPRLDAGSPVPLSKDQSDQKSADQKPAGGIAWSSLWAFTRAMGSQNIAFVVFAMFPITMGARNFTDWWVGYWIQQGDGADKSGNIDDNPDKNFYLGIYGGAALLFCLLVGAKGSLYVTRMLKASSTLHRDLVAQILRAPMSFFDVTESGQIIARFSRDVDEIDNRLVILGDQLGTFGCVIALSIVTILIIFPIFGVALFVLLTAFVSMVMFFRNVQNQLKSLDNETAGPLFSHLSASLQGLSTIHAFAKMEEFQQTFYRTLDVNSRSMVYFYDTSTWFAYRLDFLSLTVLITTGLCCVLLDVDASLAGLALVMANGMVGLFQFTTRLHAEVIARLNSVDRVVKFIQDVPSEIEPDAVERIPEGWPNAGRIEFKRVSLQYREDLPVVVHDLDLCISTAEKIGIVGRSGCGKSSLTLGLFRLMAPHKGHILIDGVDISTIPLNVLRRHLAVVPQDPQIFAGTIRSNLDPFNECEDDAVLWQALEESHLARVVADLPHKLDAVVEEDGDNLSVGQRQLLCLARVLLKRPKVLVLDEATSSVDAHTDFLIQETIRVAFANCTVLMIAHRLETILDCDKVLVLSAGRKLEFDSPRALEADPSSEFHAMLSAHHRGAGADPESSRNGELPAVLPKRRQHSMVPAL
mmetsp:Transcript_7359/g.18901  ORF Transcript_7359/g.18901 Transcript_7359/m.18901 type:complete len:1399 (+) Transcript_7359:154-4350(+)